MVLNVILRGNVKLKRPNSPCMQEKEFLGLIPQVDYLFCVTLTNFHAVPFTKRESVPKCFPYKVFFG